MAIEQAIEQGRVDVGARWPAPSGERIGRTNDGVPIDEEHMANGPSGTNHSVVVLDRVDADVDADLNADTVAVAEPRTRDRSTNQVHAPNGDDLDDLDDPAQSSVRLCLLDGFALECDGALVELPLSAQRLLAFLAFHERPVLRPYVAGCLWTDKSEERANANLRAALWRVRQPGLPLVEAVGNHLAIASAVHIDVQDTFDRARELLGKSPRAATANVDSPELDALILSGEILPDWYDDWVAVERERLRQLRLHALEALCAVLIERGEFAQAIDVALAAVAAEPLRESVHRALISAYVAEGNKAEAMRQYETYCTILWDAIGVAPSRHLVELIDDLRAPLPQQAR